MAILRCLWRPNLYIVVPRFIGVLLRCCQPVLIRWAITFVSEDLPAVENRNEAFRLILFTFVIYTGMAVCNAMYERLLNRLQCLVEMAIVGIIHNRCLTIKDGIFDEAAAVTLMSNDTSEVVYAAHLTHEVWASCVELCIGMYMLADELGWVCISPLVVVLGKPSPSPVHGVWSSAYSISPRVVTTQGVKIITGNLADRFRAFGVATQMRISTTKSILDSMKNIKMMGLVGRMEANIQAARDREIKQYVSAYRLRLAFIVGCKWANFGFFSPWSHPWTPRLTVDLDRLGVISL